MHQLLRLLTAGLWLLLGTSPVHAQQLTFTPFHYNGIHDLREKAGWTITGTESGSAGKAEFSYTIKKNNMDVIKAGALELSSGRATIELQLDEPAMLYVQVYPRGSQTRLRLTPRMAPPSR
jgi:hypothetical protein